MIHASNFSRPFLIFWFLDDGCFIRIIIHCVRKPRAQAEISRTEHRQRHAKFQNKSRDSFAIHAFPFFLLACLPSLIGLGKVVLGRTERVPSRFEMDVSIVQYGWSMSFLSPSSFHPFSSCTSCKAKAGKNKIKIKIMVHRIFPSSLPLPLPRDRNSDTGHPSPKQISV